MLKLKKIILLIVLAVFSIFALAEERHFYINFDEPTNYTVEIGGNSSTEIIRQDKNSLEINLVSTHNSYGTFKVKDEKNNTLINVTGFVDSDMYFAGFSDSSETYSSAYHSSRYDFDYDNATINVHSVNNL